MKMWLTVAIFAWMGCSSQDSVPHHPVSNPPVSNHPVSNQVPQPAHSGQKNAGIQVGKIAAPVQIQGTIGQTAGRVTVTFTQPMTDVEVQVYGIDGLVVAGDRIRVQGKSYAAQQRELLDVTYTTEADHSNLAVVVSGTVAGRRVARTASFTVGEQPSQDKNIKRTRAGERIRIMPESPR